MSATLLYRIAAVILVLFALGHTVGFLKFKPATAAGLAVRESMDRVEFQVRSSTFSYGRFYRGFGLSITAYLLFTAFLSWQLGTLARTPSSIGAIAWGFVALQVATLALSWMYFSAAPAVLSGVAVICLGWAAWLIPAVAPRVA
jgi:hypothetical protein